MVQTLIAINDRSTLLSSVRLLLVCLLSDGIDLICFDIFLHYRKRHFYPFIYSLTLRPKEELVHKTSKLNKGGVDQIRKLLNASFVITE